MEIEHHLEMGRKLLAAGQLAEALSHYHSAVGKVTHTDTHLYSHRWLTFSACVCPLGYLDLKGYFGLVEVGLYEVLTDS